MTTLTSSVVIDFIVFNKELFALTFLSIVYFFYNEREIRGYKKTITTIKQSRTKDAKMYDQIMTERDTLERKLRKRITNLKLTPVVRFIMAEGDIARNVTTKTVIKDDALVTTHTVRKKNGEGKFDHIEVYPILEEMGDSLHAVLKDTDKKLKEEESKQ